MTIAHVDNLPVPVAPPVGKLLSISTIEQAIGLAERICKTNFVPAAYRGKPEETLACILYGSELGIGPMQSLNSIDIVQGSVFLRAQLVQALARSVGGSIDVDSADDERAVVLARRPGWTVARRVEFTFEEARRQGLTGKDPWKKDPAGMLANRATTRAGRWYFADVLKGLYVEGEDLDTAFAGSDDAVAARPVETIAELAEVRKAQLPSAVASEPTQLTIDQASTAGAEGDDYLEWDKKEWANACVGKVPLAEISATWELRNFEAVANAQPEVKTEIYLAIVAAGQPVNPALTVTQGDDDRTV